MAWLSVGLDWETYGRLKRRSLTRQFEDRWSSRLGTIVIRECWVEMAELDIMLGANMLTSSVCSSVHHLLRRHVFSLWNTVGTGVSCGRFSRRLCGFWIFWRHFRGPGSLVSRVGLPCSRRGRSKRLTLRMLLRLLLLLLLLGCTCLVVTTKVWKGNGRHGSG